MRQSMKQSMMQQGIASVVQPSQREAGMLPTAQENFDAFALAPGHRNHPFEPTSRRPNSRP